MKTLKFKFIAVFATVMVLTACSLSDDSASATCFSQYYVATNNVIGADSTKVGVPVTLDVVFKTTSSCEAFNQFIEEAEVSDNKIINIGALVNKTGCECTTTNATLTKPYSFITNFPGTYKLRFITATEPIVKTIVVSP